MIDRQLWIPITLKSDPADKMLWASGQILRTYATQPCPFCKEVDLRFYYHEFRLDLKPIRRGTIWVWCVKCHLWTHVSGVKMPDVVLNTGTVSDGEIDEWEKRLRLLDWLDHLWEAGKIPHVFDVA